MSVDPIPPSRTEGYWLKFQRAKEHLDALYTEVQAFIERNPYEVVYHFEASATGDVGLHSARIRVRESPPARWSLLVGDYVHNLRSALDYVIWDISLRRSGDASIRTEFPIFEKQKEFAAPGKSPQQWSRFSGIHKLRATDGTIVMMVQAMQPFTGRDLHGRTVDPAMHPLWLLHTLANEDKHKTLTLVGTAILQGAVTFYRPDGRVIEHARARVGSFNGPFEDGAVLGSVEVPLSAAGEHDIDCGANVTFGIAFSKDGPGRGLPIFPTLPYIGQTVEAILTILEAQVRRGQ